MSKKRMAANVRESGISTVGVSERTGVARATLQLWIKTGRVAAPKLQLVGGKAVRLWTAAQVREIRKLKGRLRPGPKGPRKKSKPRGGGSRR